MDKQNSENTKQTTIRIPINDYDKIIELAKKNERKPAEQIRFMIREYIRIIENAK